MSARSKDRKTSRTTATKSNSMRFCTLRYRWCFSQMPNKLRQPWTHPKGIIVLPARGDFLRLRPEFDGAFAGDVSGAKAGIVPTAEAERFHGDRHADIDANHAGARAL